MRPFEVTCRTKEIMNKILTKMENEGILWESGKRPTEYPVYPPTTLFVDSNGKLASGVLAWCKFRGVEIAPEDYLNDKEMTKLDLRTGHIVTLKSGVEYVVYCNTCFEYGDCIVSLMEHEWDTLDHYNDDFTYINRDEDDCDIVKVEEPYYSPLEQNKSERIILWERKPKEMTVAEIEKLLGYPVKIVK